jgi:hypothetical protein
MILHYKNISVLFNASTKGLLNSTNNHFCPWLKCSVPPFIISMPIRTISRSLCGAENFLSERGEDCNNSFPQSTEQYSDVADALMSSEIDSGWNDCLIVEDAHKALVETESFTDQGKSPIRRPAVDRCKSDGYLQKLEQEDQNVTIGGCRSK